MTAVRKKVLIVDDSPSVGRFLSMVLERVPSLEVVGHALDPFEARDMIKALAPDVLTLDVEMPRMDGLTFLRNLMRLHPMPVVMVSSLTAEGAQVTLDSLEAGAVDFCVKRQPSSEADLARYTAQIGECVRAASHVRVGGGVVARSPAGSTAAVPDVGDLLRKLQGGTRPRPDIGRLVAIGASTGGPEALRQVVSTLDARGCAVLISQHMPMRFMDAFAERLNANSALEIHAAKEGEPIVAGRGYVAPGDRHLSVTRRDGELLCTLGAGPAVSGHRPSVDVMFDSVARHVGNGALGLLLTGMGEDGAAGMVKLREAGAVTLAQDEASSAVWGMPARAVALGGVDRQLALDGLGPALNRLLQAV